MLESSRPLHLAVALDGAGWHPAAWREPGARPDALFTAGYWRDVVAEAEGGLLDFVTIEDSLRLQSDDYFEPDRRTDRVRGRLDAVLTAARVAPHTRHIGIVPTAIVTHTEPFHLSRAIATLDHLSGGRAGVRVQAAGRADEQDHFGRRDFPTQHMDNLEEPEVQQAGLDHFDEAADYVEVLRRLWDSREDGADTGPVADPGRLHTIDFEGRWFSVKGPSTTPRPPQGQPLVVSLGHSGVSYRLIARAADVGFVTPRDAADAADIAGQVRAEQEAAGRDGDGLHVFGELVVLLDESEQAAADRLGRLDERAGAAYESDALVFTGTASGLTDLMEEWRQAGLTGFRLRPAVAAHDLPRIARDLAGELRRRGLFRTAYQAGTLRGLLGLPRPAGRYATA
ncbi:LLM class flavin-dependent oxidoreductase [Streptomyces sp. WI04-05B]|uniref:LLM class flavin-dependent oxidoreductase n=1 Tax=Streptomyces TaxID=1883 RepID=UPI0029BE9164|nr:MULTISPECIES: LLM class flavin-dependent oxidoreductase [unclassified Streptomyces]MDX2546500.1 LLM class flavin-dependent oxidoreductase [Streptomyces sp. WI04-05B]MDX2587868.1 LLM class flavin-dependent oxidoreductase [Streptomyces sp. WI04-05A]MDX3751534.1 LLM class flavin-dependent oxidoreductase [Streptomyces sp. AK08-02]